MTLESDFQAAAKKVENLPKKPTDAELLEIYGLYKQATVGDVNTDRPGMFDMKGKAKWDAWEKNKSKSKDEAMQQYIQKVAVLSETYAG